MHFISLPVAASILLPLWRFRAHGLADRTSDDQRFSCCCFALVCRFVSSIKREENNCYNYVNKIFSSWNVRLCCSRPSSGWMRSGNHVKQQATSACTECLHTTFRLQLPLPVCLVNICKWNSEVLRAAQTLGRSLLPYNAIHATDGK